MEYTTRVSLENYDAEYDNNPDHFALFSDDDNVLIKEFTRGSATIPWDNTQPYTIAHNLGYVPFFLVFAYDTNARLDPNADANQWKLVPSPQLAAVTPPFYAYADTTNLYIWNLDFPNDTDFKWYIFYDNVVGTSNNSLEFSDFVFSVAKKGYNAEFEKDPNNFVFHSDLNTFKILKEGNSTITYTSDGRYSINHGLTNYTPTSFMLFIKFPDGYTGVSVGTGRLFSSDGNFRVSDTYITATQIKFYLERLGGSSTSLNCKYYIFETPLE